MTMRNQTPAANGGNAGQWFVRIEHQWRRLVIRLRARLGLVDCDLASLCLCVLTAPVPTQRRRGAETQRGFGTEAGAWPVSTAELMRT